MELYSSGAEKYYKTYISIIFKLFSNKDWCVGCDSKTLEINAS